MVRNTVDKGYQIEFTLLNFIFLLVLIVNAVIIADLFLSVLQSPLTLIFIRVVIMLIVLGFLVSNSARHPEIRGSGWYFLLSGFSLVFLGSLIEFISRLPYTSSVVFYFGQPAVRFFENIFCELFGYFCLAYGFFLWIPSILEARRRIEQTALELERKVAERTRSLKNSNEELYRSKLKLEEAIRLKNEFLASFSHELKTPLNSILGFCRLLREQHQGPLTPKQLKSIKIVENNSKSLLERINKILDIAKLEFEKVAIEIRPVKLSALLREVASVVEPMLKDKPIKLVIEKDKNLTEVHTDRKLLTQLLLGVLDNAIKFTESGTIKISTGADRQNQRWWIGVSDTGQGIRKSDLPFIFDAFRQGNGSLSRRFGGTGLGLAIARKQAQLLEGKIEVESTEGSGTTFTFNFPLKPRPPLEQPAETSSETTPAKEDSTN